MRSSRPITALAIIVLALAACTKPTPPDTVPPAVTLDSPAGGTSFTLGAPVSLAGTATDAGGVAGVTVLVAGAEVNTVVPADGNWQFEWLPAAVGQYAVSARGTDKAGNSATTAAITVIVTPTTPAVTTGGIGGSISRSGLGQTAIAAAEAAAAKAAPAPIVPGELFVVFKPGVRDVTFGTKDTAARGGFTFKADGGFSFRGSNLELSRSYPANLGLALYRTGELTEVATNTLISNLRASPLVAEVFPNWILSAHAEPNDTLYAQQWHYSQLNLPAAWDIETGTTAKVTVAVLDTGRIDHLDMQWAAGGANFANWSYDTDAPGEGVLDDPHTLPGGSPHGTHVAGTIGATTGNAEGVAGVNWNVDLLPVKVLTANGSGTFAGILEGVYWAAGADFPEYAGHVNANIPRVLNMSLGGNVEMACPASLNDIFATLADMGIYTVVSAGNDASPADVYFPANCPSVITVGATGPTAIRASYSNVGPYLDVMAPGGDYFATDPTGALRDGVLSTIDGSTYAWYQGTSMASPHVAGVVSLMLAREPNLTLEQVRQRLHDASMPLSLAECNVATLGLIGLNNCGAGLLDAAAALRGEVLTTPRAFAYAVADSAADPVLFGELPALEKLAQYKTEATAAADGSFTYSLVGLAPGTYQVIALELRDPESGISAIDRIGIAQDVVVTAGGVAALDLSVVPMYSLLPVTAD